jgi:hypothetical protein
MTNKLTKKTGHCVCMERSREEGRAKARPYNQTSAARKEEKRRQAAALHRRFDAVRVWKEFEDLLIPRLRLSVIERAVYSHLLRHSRLEGRQRLRFSIQWLARGAGLSEWAARKGVRQLMAKGALRLTERSKRGHVVEVRLPGEVRAVRARKIEAGQAERLFGAANLEEADFLETRALRQAIHAREGGYCFYCLRRLTSAMRCIDHVTPRVRMGCNSYRNLVSSCAECNSQKGERRAEDFLRWLCREGRLATSELTARLRELDRLASGKLRPAVAECQGKDLTRKAQSEDHGAHGAGNAKGVERRAARPFFCGAQQSNATAMA